MILVLSPNRLEGCSHHPDVQRSATGVFLDTFKRLKKRAIVPTVFYPAVQLPSEEDIAEAQRSWEPRLDAELAGFLHGKRVFLSINRFERKKVYIHILCRFSNCK